MSIQDMEPTPVRVSNWDEFQSVPTREHEPEHFTFYTVTLTPGGDANGQAQYLLAEDPLRKDAALISWDANIVLCHSAAQAKSVANNLTGFPDPDGALILQGSNVSLSGTGIVYAATQANTRVSVIVNRRKPE